MAQHRSRWLAPLFRTPKTLRNQPNANLARLTVLPLEDRLAPAAFTGPVHHGQLETIDSLGLTSITPVATIPTSPTGAVSYLNLVSSNAFTLNTPVFTNLLNAAPAEYSPTPITLALPRPDGTYERFNIWQAQILAPELQAEFPDIHTYRGQSIDNPAVTLAADITPLGFHAQVLSPNASWFIDPYYHLDDSVYVSYFKQDLENIHGGGCQCALCNQAISGSGDGGDGGSIMLEGSGGGISLQGPTLSYGSTLRTFRTAVAATGEYTAFFGGTVANGQAAIVTAINRVSAVYEIELTARLQLVANNSSVVYTNSSTDPYTNNNGSSMLSQNQTTMTNVIGSANYDLGHVFSTGGGGVAVLNSLGNNSTKAQGVTGSPSPSGDAFWIDYVAHEMGHQFGGNHSFNTSQDTQRNSSTAYEPGSASTIMGYAGIVGGGDDLQSNSDAYFHVHNLNEARNRINAIPGVGTSTSNGNLVPTVSAGPDYSIPAGTPFGLAATGSDGNGDALTYTWEQYDLGAANTIATISAGNTTTGPVIRSFTGTTNPTRTIPRLSNLLANTKATGEYLSNVARTLNFTITARDNRAGGGGVATDSNVITVVGGAAFAVTAPNTAVSWTGGTSQTVTWNVGSTTAAPINTSLVNILLSTDGGNTFPTTLLANTPNDGSQTIVVPNGATSAARIRVQPIGNIYFDVSNTNFTIVNGPLTLGSITPTSGSTLTGPVETIDFTFNLPIDAVTISTSDLTVNMGSVTAAALQGTNTVRYTVSGLFSAGSLAVSLPAGVLASTTGQTNAAANASFNVVPPGLNPTGFTVNGGAVQRSRITTLEVNFNGLVTAADFNTLGAIQLRRTAVSSIPTGAVYDLVQTGPADASHITVTQGTATSLVLTFDNGGSFNSTSTGVENGSLTDGYWQLTIGTFSSTLNDLALRRLYGDNTVSAGGVIDGFDGVILGNNFGMASATFDFNNDNTVDGFDLGTFGNRWGNSL